MANPTGYYITGGQAVPAIQAAYVAGQNAKTLANGLNSNVDSAGQPSIRAVGPTGAFSLGGISPGSGQTWSPGQTIVFINTTSQPMTVINGDASSAAGNRITTGSGANVLLPPRPGVLLFTYDGTSNSLVLQNTGQIYQRLLDVRDFGADPTGVADCYTAFSAAITAAGVSGTVYFPSIPGGATYLCSAALSPPPGVSLIGDDMAHVSILFYNATNGIVWAGAAYNTNAGIITGLTLSGIGTGLTGLEVAKTNLAKVSRCKVAGWTQQGIYFLDTSLTHFENNYVYASGGATYGEVEIDALGWGSGGGSTNFTWLNNVIGAGNSGALCGLRIDRSTNVSCSKGAVESTGGAPIIVSGRSVSDAVGQGTNGVVLDLLDIENPQGSAVSFVDIGYGLPGGAAVAVALLPKVTNCAFYASGSVLAKKAIRISNSYGALVDGCGISQGSPTGGALGGVWFEGLTNQFHSVGFNVPDTYSNPYVVVNGVTVGQSTWGKPWNWSMSSLSVPVASGIYTLVGYNQYAYNYLSFTGTLTATVVVVLPTNVSQSWTLDTTSVTLSGKSFFVMANTITWGTSVTNGVYSVVYGGTGKLYGTTLTS